MCTRTHFQTPTYSHTISRTFVLSLSLSHTHTPSCPPFSLALSHKTHTHTLSLPLPLSLSFSLSLSLSLLSLTHQLTRTYIQCGNAGQRTGGESLHWIKHDVKEPRRFKVMFFSCFVLSPKCVFVLFYKHAT